MFKIIRKWYFKIYHLFKLLGVFVLVFGLKGEVLAESICNVNLWDQETINGYYRSSDGAYRSTPTELCSENFIKVEPNTKYDFITPVVNGNAVRGYGENKNYIGSLGSSVSSFTTGSNCYYVKINLGSNYGATYNNDVAIKLADCIEPEPDNDNVYANFLDLYTNRITYLAEGFTNNPYLLAMIGIIFSFIILEITLKLFHMRGGKK